MTNANASVKTEVINNIMLQMSMYLEKSMMDILQRVIEEQIHELKERDTARSPEPAPLGMDGMVYPSCGKKALPWDRFCGECGQRFWED